MGVVTKALDGRLTAALMSDGAVLAGRGEVDDGAAARSAADQQPVACAGDRGDVEIDAHRAGAAAVEGRDGQRLAGAVVGGAEIDQAGVGDGPADGGGARGV